MLEKHRRVLWRATTGVNRLKDEDTAVIVRIVSVEYQGRLSWWAEVHVGTAGHPRLESVSALLLRSAEVATG